jgi:ribosomal protein S12 methylthiotransferase accessory factor
VEGDRVQVLGTSEACERVRESLSSYHRGHSSVSVVAGWPDIQHLQRFSETASTPWILIEENGEGGFTIGPMFRRGRKGCFYCYIARRRANGARECRPVSAVSPQMVALLRGELDAAITPDSRSFARQIAVFPTGVMESHIFLPVPNCRECADAPALGNGATGSLALVSNRLGIVHEVAAWRPLPEPFTSAIAVGCRTDALWSSRALNQGIAVDDDADRARLRAVAESVERYCAAAVPADLVTCRSTDLEGRYVAPSRLGFITGSNEEHCVFSWVRARTIEDEREVWVPASAIYMPFTKCGVEAAIQLQSSVGLAAHLNLEEAVRHGLFEVLERDACLRAWRRGLPVESVSHDFLEMDGLYLVRVPSDSGLCVIACFIERAEPPFTSTGLAARPTFDDAARHAILEAMLSHVWLCDRLATHGPESRADPVRTMVDNAVAHAVCEHLRASRRRWLDAVHSETKIPEASWANIVNRLPEACFVEITTPDVAAIGMRVVRVLVPDKVLSDDDSLNPRLAGDRTPHPFG